LGYIRFRYKRKKIPKAQIRVMARTRKILHPSQFPQTAIGSATIYADLEVQFAGQTAHYKHLPFQQAAQGNAVRISGIIPATCSDFKIDRPSFLTVPIKNEIPVRVDMTWHQSP